MINVYDFDKTIYDGDSSIDFYLFCLKEKKSILLLLPLQIFAMILYKLKIKEKEYFKEQFFSFVKKFDNIDLLVEKFWKKNLKKIKSWYLDNSKTTDIIISASPDFLLNPLKEKLKVNKVIATKVDKKTGKFLSKNCYGIEKVKRFKEESKKKIGNFYSDSISDKPIGELANKFYCVNKNKISEFDFDDYKKNKFFSILILLFNVVMFIVFSYVLFNVVFNNHRSIPNSKPLELLIFLVIYTFFVNILVKLFSRRIKHKKVFVIILFCLLFVSQLIFAYYFAVTPTWDFGSVYNGAIYDMTNQIKLSSNDYFYRYGNNLGIVLLLKFYYSIFNFIGFKHFVFLGICLNIVMIDIAVIYLYKTIRLFFSEKASYVFLILSLLFTPFIAYTPIFYTDTISMPFGIAGIYYFCKYFSKHNMKYLLLSGVLLGIGCDLKFTVVVYLIAIIMYVILRRNKFITKMKIIFVILLAFIIPVMSLNIYSEKNFDQTKMNKEKFPLTHWVMMGLHGVGAFYSIDVDYTSKFNTVEKKKKADIKIIERRIKNMIKNNKLLDFYTDKAVFVWGDGTFFAPEKLRRQPYKSEKINKYILDSKYNKVYNTVAQGQLVFTLIFVILGIAFRKFLTKRQKDFQLLLNITIFGVFIFFLIWESRSRYIVNFIPVILLSSYLGIVAFRNFILRVMKKN